MAFRSATPWLAHLAGAAVLAAAGMLAACGDSGSSSLMSGAGGNGPQGSPLPSGPTASSVASSSSASTSTPVAADAGPPESKGEQMFHALQSQLVAGCGGAGGECHVNGAFQSAPVWLGQPDAYLSAKAYPGVITSDPYSSILLLKGPHEGPAFSGPLSALGDLVTAWLTEEATEIVTKPLPATTPVSVSAGPNVIDISGITPGIPGASIAFIASFSGEILTLTNLSVQAPAASGLHIAHPVFAVVPSGGHAIPDPVDSFSNVDQTIGVAKSTTLGPGILVLEGYSGGATLQIEFNTLAAVAPPPPPDAGAGGGCKNVAAFTANAVPAIQANQCLNCHNTGGPGNSSLDLSQVGIDDAVACAQALTKVDLANPSQSEIILAPTGQVPSHPFQGASATYTTMMLAWITTE
jgi:hypothetical protein